MRFLIILLLLPSGLAIDQALDNSLWRPTTAAPAQTPTTTTKSPMVRECQTELRKNQDLVIAVKHNLAIETQRADRLANSLRELSNRHKELRSQLATSTTTTTTTTTSTPTPTSTTTTTTTTKNPFEAEYAVCQTNLISLNSTITQLQTNISTLETEKGRADADLKDTKRKQAENVAALTTAGLRIRELEEEEAALDSLNVAHDLLDQQYQELQDEYQQLERTKTHLLRDFNLQRENLEQARQDLENAQRLVTTLETNLTSIMAAKPGPEDDDCSTEKMALDALSRNFTESVQALNSKLLSHSSNISSQIQNLKQIQGALDQATVDRDYHKSNFNTLQIEFDNVSNELLAARGHLRNLRTNFDSQNDRLEYYRGLLSLRDSALKNLNAELTELKEKEQTSDCAETINNRISILLQEKETLLQERSDFQKKYNDERELHLLTVSNLAKFQQLHKYSEINLTAVQSNFSSTHDNLTTLLNTCSQDLIREEASRLNLTTQLDSLQDVSNDLKHSQDEVLSLMEKLDLANKELARQSSFNQKLLLQLHLLDQAKSTTTTSTTTTTTAKPLKPRLLTPALKDVHDMSHETRKSTHKLQKVPVDALNFRTNGWFSSLLETPIVFSELGTALGSLDLAHLQININVKHLWAKAKVICLTLQEGDVMVHTTTSDQEFYRSLVKAMGNLCVSKVYELEEFLNSMTSDGIRAETLKFLQEPHHRERRQGEFLLGAVVGVIIALVSSNILSDSQVLGLASGSGTSPLAIRTLQDHETRIAVSEHSLETLKNITDGLADDIEETRTETSTINFILKLKIAVDDVLTEIDRVLQGLTEIHHHRLSPFLVDTEVLSDLLKELQFRIDKGMTLGVDHVEDLFRMETSHIGYKNGTLTVFIHVPCFRPDSKFTLYRYVPSALPISGHSEFLVPHPDNEYLIVDEQQTLFRSFGDEIFASCLRLHKHFYCKNLNLYYSAGESDCLFSMFNQKTEIAHRQCRFSITNTLPSIYQLDTRTFLAIGVNSSTITKRCPLENPVEETRVVHGPSIISPPPGCRIIGSGYTIDGTRDIYFSPTSVHFRYLDLADAVEKIDIPHFASKVHKEMIKDLGSSKGVKVKDIASQLKHENLVHQITVFSSLSIGLVIMITLCCCCYCYCKGWPDPILPKRFRSKPLQIINQNPPYQPPIPLAQRPLLNPNVPPGLPPFDDL